jgi:hypothetical protein
MKRYFSFLIMFGLVVCFFSCEKNTRLTEDAEDIIPYLGPDHCYNGELDGDEIQIDCGGSCSECVQIIPSCSIPIGTLTVNGTSYPVYSISSDIDNSTSEFSCTSGNMTMDITVDSPLNTNLEYNIVDEGNPVGSQMDVYMNNPIGTASWYTNAVGGSGYITESDNGSYEVYLCSALYSGKTMDLHILIP